MKKRKAHFQISIFHFPLLLLLFSCSRGGDTVAIDEGGIDGLTPPVVIEIASRSTAAGTGEAKTVFKEGTSIGIVPSVGTSREYVYNANGTFTAAGEKIFFERGVEQIAAEAFYPYNASGYARLPVKADQSGKTDGESNYYLSDVLHAAGSTMKTSNNLKLKFHHVMSKLIFTVSPEAAATITSLTLGQQPLSAKFSFKADGSVNAASDIDAATSTITAYTADNGTTWRAIIIPRDNANLLPLQVITADGKKYEVKQLATNNFKPGQQYTYTITVKNGFLTVSPTNITSWTNDGEQKITSYPLLPGSGTQDDPFQVASFDDFKKIQNDLGAYYKQTAIIDMNGMPFTGIEGTFTGTYDGNGFEIIKMFVTRDASYTGLFQKNQGTIKKVKITSGLSRVDGYTGGVICGRNMSGGKITDCTNAAPLTSHGQENAGGICGMNEGEISNCTNSGEINGSGNTCGGICGMNSGGTVSKCTNTGKISRDSSSDTVGGICGSNMFGTISDCNNSGEIKGDGNNYGGICGLLMNGTISGCKNTGSLSGNGSDRNSICGKNQGGTIK